MHEVAGKLHIEARAEHAVHLALGAIAQKLERVIADGGDVHTLIPINTIGYYSIPSFAQ